MKMKQKGFWAGIPASMLIFGLVFVSCGGDDGGGKAPALTGSVVITGVAQVGKTLTANTEQLGGSGDNIRYQWKRADTEAGEATDIADATASTYIPVTGDANDGGKYLTVTVTRTGYTESVTSVATSAVLAEGVDAPTVTAVTVSPSTASVVKGGNATFTATVTGSNSPAQTVIWSITETGKKAGTAIDGNGKLIVAADEALTSLTVKATSAVDTGKSGTAAVTVTVFSDPPFPPSESLPPSSGTNPLNGKKYFEDREKIEFAADATYKKYGVNKSGGNPVLTDGGKYAYVEIENGTYSWDETAQTVTLKPGKVASEGANGTYETAKDKAGYRADWKALMEAQIAAAESGFDLAATLANLGYSSLDVYVDYMAAVAFANTAYDYALSSDGNALFLDETLPANKGTDALTGKTFKALNGAKNTLIFTDNGTYTETNTGFSAAGEYTYNGTTKRVYCRGTTVDGKAKEQFYTDTSSEHSERYENATDAKAAETNGIFSFSAYRYDLTAGTLNRMR